MSSNQLQYLLLLFEVNYLFPIDICLSLRRHFHPKMLYENKKSHFTAKRHILEKNVKSTTPPFVAILPTRDLLETPTVKILGLKSDFDFFWGAD